MSKYKLVCNRLTCYSKIKLFKTIKTKVKQLKFSKKIYLINKFLPKWSKGKTFFSKIIFFRFLVRRLLKFLFLHC
jgi:hypothetical protein